MWYIRFENPRQDIRFKKIEDANKYYIMCKIIGSNVTLIHKTK